MSWLNLSDNLSNLSGNFSSITGQISSFTREVLTEGTEENFDQDTEVKLAKIKIKDLENILNKQKAELERINGLNDELREKVDSGELQMQAMSHEYRSLIEVKEKEINQLKFSVNEVQNEHSQSLSRDEMDFDDSEFSHMTVQRLKNELKDVTAECEHWKQASKNQSNQAELQRIKDEHHHEISSLQSTYSQRISQMNKKHKSELEDLIIENEQLTQTLADRESEIESLSRVNQSEGIADAKSGNLEEKCKKLTLDFEIKRKQLESLQAQMLEEKKCKKQLEDENVRLKDELVISVNKMKDLQSEIELLGSKADETGKAGEGEKLMQVELDKQKELENIDAMWRKKFDDVLHDLNGARDENVELSLELSQQEEQCEVLEKEKMRLSDEISKCKEENEQLKIEKESLKEDVSDLERLRADIARLSSCTVDLLDELQFQKSLSGEQDLEIESLRKICTIKGSPAEEIKKMQKSLKELGGRYVELYNHYKKVSFELRKSNDRLLAERQLRHANASELREEVSIACQRMRDTADAKLHSCVEETNTVRDEMTHLNQQVDHREKIVSELEMEVDYVAGQTAKIVSEFACQVKQSDITPQGDNEAETIESLVAEKEILERTIEGLERKAGALEHLVASLQESIANRDRHYGSAKGSDLSSCNSDTEQDRSMSIEQIKETGNKQPELMKAVSLAESVSTTDGYYIDDDHPRDNTTWPMNDVHNNRQKRIINELETTLLEREKELYEMISIKNDLEFEKSTLEKVVLDLQKKYKIARDASSKLAEQGHDITRVSHQGSATDVSSLDWDSLVEAIDDNEAMRTELHQVKDDIESMETLIDDLMSDVSKDLFVSEAKKDFQHISPLKKLRKLDGIVKEVILELSQEVEKLKENCGNLEDGMTATDSKVTEIFEFLLDTFKERGGNCHGLDFHSNQPREEKLESLKSVLTNFILECCGETDADKWRHLHDEAVAAKEQVVEEVIRLKENLEVWKTRHQSLRDENTSLLETLDLLRQDLELMSQGQSALVAERETLQSELDKLQFQIDTNETDDSKEIGELKMQLDDMKIERERIMKMVDERDDFITEQQEKHDGLVEEIVNEKDRDLIQIQEELEETMKLYKDKQKECEESMVKVESLEESFRDAEKKTGSLEKSLLVLEKEKETLQFEVNDQRLQAKENEVLMKNLQDVDEELREKETVEEDLLRELELQAEELRAENTCLRNELGAYNSTNIHLQRDDDSRSELGSMKKQLDKAVLENKELVGEIESLNRAIESLKVKLVELESRELQRTLPAVELNGTNTRENHKETRVEESIGLVVNESKRGETVVVIETQTEAVNEEKKTVQDYVKLKERLVELEYEIEVYKGDRRKVDEKELEIDKYKNEIGRMMQVLRSKDELLLNLEMMEGEPANDQSPFSSRARVIQYIRDKEMELSYTQEKMRSLEELIRNNTHQLQLLKVERQNLLILMKTKEADAIDLNERLENVQARSAAKEQASAVLHFEHQKLLELNKSQGSEIARLRERNQYLQNVLQEKQGHSDNEKKLTRRNEELEIQVAAFQQEQERLLTLIHEKDKSYLDLRKQLQDSQLLQSNSFVEGRHVVEYSNEIKSGKKRSNVVGSEIGSNSDTGVAKGITDIEMSKESLNYTENIDLLTDATDGRSERSLAGNKETSELHSQASHSVDYERTIQEYKQRHDVLSADNAKLSKDYDELKQKLELVESEKSNIRIGVDKEIREKDNYIKGCEGHVEELKKRVAEVTQNIEKERIRAAQNYESGTGLLAKEWHEKVSQKDEEIKSLKEKIELLETYKERLEHVGQSTVNKTVSQIDVLTSENRKLRTFYEEKKNEMSVLQSDIHRLKNYAAASEAALSKMQTDNMYMIEEGQKKDADLEELKKSKSLAAQRIQEFETEVHRLTVKCREVEAKAAKEMERFRNHLIAIEEGYTNEAVVSRDKEAQLEQQVRELQSLLQKRQSEYQHNSNQSSFQIQNLQQELMAVASQRDNAHMRLSEAEERARQNETALINLQMALEQFQKEKDSQHEMLAEQSKKKLFAAEKEIEDMRRREFSFHARIQEANLAVQGVANLSGQVKAKDDQIELLQTQVANLENDAHAKSEVINKLKSSSEGKIEKPLMKNLLIGYFHTPESKRADVIRVIGNLVGFSHDEIAEVGNGAPPSQRTWVSSLIPFGGGNKPVAKTHTERRIPLLSQSFSEMFVSFLEEESDAATKSTRPTANQLTSLLMQTPASTSIPVVSDGKSNEVQQTLSQESHISNPLLITPQAAKSMQATAFKTSLPLLPSSMSSSALLFPAPGQEIPKIRTSTANSALKTMLSK
eukprot:gene20327-22326_t